MLTEPMRVARPAERSDKYRDTPVGHLLRCWVRELAIAEPVDGMLRLVLTTADVEVHAPVEYWSPVGWHRFGPARFVGMHGEHSDVERAGDAVDPGTLAALLAAEAGSGTPDATVDLITRVADSAANTARFLARRRLHPTDPAGTTPFLASEQALLTGDPLHPAPKSRDGLRGALPAAYFPELRGGFPLHWFAADPAVIRADSALPETAQDLIAGLGGTRVRVPAGMVPIPAHPWQARNLRGHTGIRQLLDSGLLRDLGPDGAPWYPTSTLRTVYRADAPFMLELSVGLRVAGSRRENAHEDLRQGVAVHRLLDSGLGAELAAAHPGFAIVRDCAWLAVQPPDGEALDGSLSVVLRENPFGPGVLAHCVAGLVAERPGTGPSLLAWLVRGLAARSRRPVSDVSREWFGRYVAAVAEPILWLHAEHGIALAAHRQNTLVVVNGGGWPVGGRYRDDRGESIAEDAIAAERLCRDLGVNNLMGLIGAFGSQSLADERVLLADLRAALTDFAARSRHASGAVEALLDRDSLRCEANLLTLIGGVDELSEPTANRPVYVDIPNPLAS